MDLRAIVKNAYRKDTICAKIIAQPDAYPRFGIWEGLIWTKNQLKCDVICIPQDIFQRGRRLIEIIIDHVHQTIGHYGQWKTLNYIRWSYWWPQMATDIEAFCRLCGKCQTNKTDTETTRVSTQLAYTRQAIAVSGYGLHGTIALVTRQ